MSQTEKVELRNTEKKGEVGEKNPKVVTGRFFLENYFLLQGMAFREYLESVDRLDATKTVWEM